MFMAGGTSDVSVVNVSDPANPQLCATYGQSSDTLVTWGLALYQNQVYVGYIYNPWCFPFCAYWPGLKMLTWNNACALDVKDHPTEQVLSIYPNPASALVTLSSVPDNAQPRLYDMTGRPVEVAMQGAGSTVTLNLRDIAKGIYFVKCGTQNQRLVVN